jgi:MFS family permease
MADANRRGTSAADTSSVTAVGAQWLWLPVLMAGTFVIVLDFFVVYVALPVIRPSLHASAGVLECVVAGYGLTFAMSSVTAGRLGDHVGTGAWPRLPARTRSSRSLSSCNWSVPVATQLTASATAILSSAAPARLTAGTH